MASLRLGAGLRLGLGRGRSLGNGPSLGVLRWERGCWLAPVSCIEGHRKQQFCLLCAPSETWGLSV